MHIFSHNLSASSTPRCTKCDMAETELVAARFELAMDEDLTDEQMEQLLARATARLQQKATPAQSKKTGEKAPYTFPKLNPGALEKPYVTTQGDVATVDATRLLEEKHRKQANGIRKVEDPVASKKLALEVRLTPFHMPRFAMRKTFPISSRAEFGHRLGRLSAS
jgi:hypothetical protein